MIVDHEDLQSVSKPEIFKILWYCFESILSIRNNNISENYKITMIIISF